MLRQHHIELGDAKGTGSQRNGLAVGVTTSLIGTLGLMLFDPFTPIGPIMKLLATIPIILSLDLGMRLWKIKPYSGE